MVGNPAAVSAAVSRHRHNAEADSGDCYSEAVHQQSTPHHHHHSTAPPSAPAPPVQGFPVAYGQPVPPVTGFPSSQPYAPTPPYHPVAAVGVASGYGNATVLACPGCGEYYPLPAGADTWRCKRCGKMNALRPENLCAVL